MEEDISYITLYGKIKELDFIITYYDDEGKEVIQDGYYYTNGSVYFLEEEEPIGYLLHNKNTPLFTTINTIVDFILDDIRRQYRTDDIDFKRIEVNQP